MICLKTIQDQIIPLIMIMELLFLHSVNNNKRESLIWQFCNLIQGTFPEMLLKIETNETVLIW